MPKPINTKGVSLGEELAELTEYLAKNTHEVWSTQRMKDGWIWGKKRDDELKHHPCLIPYEELPDEEKEYDRNTALETLKTILSLGYNIQPPLGKEGEASEENVRSLVNFIREKNIDIENVFQIWHNRTKSHWHKRVEIYIAFAERALGNAEHLLAYDILREGQTLYPENVRILQLMGLTLARLGLQGDALEILENLYKVQKLEDEETLGLLGRLYKDFWMKKNEEKFFVASLHYYRLCYQKFKSAWAGINLATLYQLSGDQEKAYQYSSEIKKICLKTIESGTDDYWTYATLGEANLLEKDYLAAIDWYEKGVKKNASNIGNINSSRRNVQLLYDRLKTPLKYQHRINALLCVPKVLVFTGHRVDEEGRENPRFPEEIVGKTKAALKEYLEGLGPCIGYCSGANGGDLIFIEAMEELGNKVHVIIPFPKDDFIEESVTTLHQSDWVERFHMLYERNVNVTELDHLGIDLREDAYIFANRIIYGMARMRAQQLGTNVFPISIFDTREMEKQTAPGGTCHVLYEWQVRGNTIEIFDLPTLMAGKMTFQKKLGPFKKGKKFSQSTKTTKTCGILFCDAVNYSQLKNTEFVLFNRIIHQIIEDVKAARKYNILYQNIWGDGLHFVFRNLEETGQFALQFTKLLAEHPWSRNGLSQPVQFRTAVHAGPVFETEDPLSNQKQYVGSHVCRTARMESLTPPGEVYASQEFAALTQALHVESFHCAYVGKMYIQKERLEAPLYHLREKK